MQRDTQTDGQAEGSQTDSQTGPCRGTPRQTDRQQTDRQTDRTHQTDRQPVGQADEKRVACTVTTSYIVVYSARQMNSELRFHVKLGNW